MDANHQNGINKNLVTSENKLWLPPSYTNGKTPIASAQKKRSINWGFADRSFWEWLLLIGTLLAAIGAIVIPVAIGVGTSWFSYQQNRTSQQIALDQQRESMLQAYFDTMSDLMLNHKLLTSSPNDEVRQVATTRTLTVLQSLDPVRKGILLQFLQQSHLIDVNKPIIYLEGADLSGMILAKEFYEFGFKSSETTEYIGYLEGTDLQGANLSGAYLVGAYLDDTNLNGSILTHADLTKAILRGANLSYSNLSDANLQGAIVGMSNISISSTDLSGADLSGANLKGIILEFTTFEKLEEQAYSLKGATMPDGSIHP